MARAADPGHSYSDAGRRMSLAAGRKRTRRAVSMTDEATSRDVRRRTGALVDAIAADGAQPAADLGSEALLPDFPEQGAGPRAAWGHVGVIREWAPAVGHSAPGRRGRGGAPAGAGLADVPACGTARRAVARPAAGNERRRFAKRPVCGRERGREACRAGAPVGPRSHGRLLSRVHPHRLHLDSRAPPRPGPRGRAPRSSSLRASLVWIAARRTRPPRVLIPASARRGSVLGRESLGQWGGAWVLSVLRKGGPTPFSHPFPAARAC